MRAFGKRLCFSPGEPHSMALIAVAVKGEERGDNVRDVLIQCMPGVLDEQLCTFAVRVVTARQQPRWRSPMT